MYKLYSVWKNTGDWGGHSSRIVIAENEDEAMLSAFMGDREDRVKQLEEWKNRRWDIRANEAKDNDFISHEIRMTTVPKGYKLKIDVSVEIVKDEVE